MKAASALIVSLLALSPCVYAAPAVPSVSVSVIPEIVFPLWGDSELFAIGGGGSLSGTVGLAGVPWLSLYAELGYAGVPVRAASTLTLLSLSGGAGFRWRIAPRLDAWAGIGAGYSAAGLSSTAFLGPERLWEGYPSLSARAGATFLLSSSWSLGIGLSYRSYPRLLQLAGASVEATCAISSLWDAPLRIERVAVDELFPAMYLAYAKEPPGKVVVRNTGRFPVTDLEASILVDPYMSRPAATKLSSSIAPGEKLEINLPMVFNDRVLGIVEGTEFPALLKLTYACAGRKMDCSETVTIKIHGRNSLTWEDDRKAALFVSEKDPVVQRFAGTTVSAMREFGFQGINVPFRLAAGLHAALRAHGVSYVADSATPYAGLVKDSHAVDMLKFPRQTLAYKAGDCDDLTILYCALLESMDVETAFITLPGHILPAVSLAMNPREAESLFSSAEDLIFDGARTWLPIEITALAGGFLDAWSSGARQWRDGMREGSARICPVREAWKVFPPVSLAVGDQDMSCPPAEEVMHRFDSDMGTFTYRELGAKIAQLRERHGGPRGTSGERNAVGVLYAQYGRYVEAEKEFLRIVEQDEYPPALLNLGNVAYIRGEYRASLEYFSRVLLREPGSWKALLGLAQASHKLELADEARNYYRLLRAARPDVADRFAYLVTGTAEDVRGRALYDASGEIEWQGEE